MENVKNLISKRRWLRENGKELSKKKLTELTDYLMDTAYPQNQDGKDGRTIH